MQSTLTWEAPWGLHVHVAGVLTPEEFFARTTSVTQDPRFNDLRYAILNYLDVPSHTFDLNDSAALAHANAMLIGATTTNPHIVAAIVARPAILDLARTMAEVSKIRWRIGFFESELKALEWLSTQSLVFRQRPLA